MSPRPLLRSQLYECRIRHERFHPRPHHFSYRLFYLAADLDELAELHRRLALFSVNRRNLFSLRETDYFPRDGGLPLKARVAAFCAERDFPLGDNPSVTLVTVPHVFGRGFNPVSFYLCRRAPDEPVCAVAEVTNTFGEVKLYLIPSEPGPEGWEKFANRQRKDFYVSPFSEPGSDFLFTVAARRGEFAVRIDVIEGGRRTVHATLFGRARALSDRNLLQLLARFPFAAGGVLARIHWEAFRLWLKRLPHHRKDEHLDSQRDVIRPHPSLTPPNRS